MFIMLRSAWFDDVRSRKCNASRRGLIQKRATLTTLKWCQLCGKRAIFII